MTPTQHMGVEAMGYRTVVILSNDLASDWENDPELGKKISNSCFGKDPFTYGTVAETTHCDVQTLMTIDGTIGRGQVYTNWYRNQTKEEMELALLKEFANKLGYRIVKKPAKKA